MLGQVMTRLLVGTLGSLLLARSIASSSFREKCDLQNDSFKLFKLHNHGLNCRYQCNTVFSVADVKDAVSFSDWWAEFYKKCVYTERCKPKINVQIIMPLSRFREFGDDAWGFDLGCSITDQMLHIRDNMIFFEDHGREKWYKMQGARIYYANMPMFVKDLASESVTKPSFEQRKVILKENYNTVSAVFSNFHIREHGKEYYGVFPYGKEAAQGTMVFTYHKQSFDGQNVLFDLEPGVASPNAELTQFNSTKSFHNCGSYKK